MTFFRFGPTLIEIRSEHHSIPSTRPMRYWLIVNPYQEQQTATRKAELHTSIILAFAPNVTELIPTGMMRKPTYQGGYNCKDWRFHVWELERALSLKQQTTQDTRAPT
mmetsp:Transcript_13636/g.20003  ORF Transcript_13636/g.20003 Transcript_13636/m.20003 type:complete len:108 (+) Transcript_13636:470-793(+)